MNEWLKYLLIENGISYKQLADKTGRSVDGIKWMMNNPLTEKRKKLFRKAIEEIKQDSQKETVNPASQADKNRLYDICQKLLEVDPSKELMVHLIKVEADTDVFPKEICMKYIEYLKKTITETKKKKDILK